MTRTGYYQSDRMMNQYYSSQINSNPSYNNTITERFLQNPNCTPLDRFLARSHLIELKEPTDLRNGSSWDQLSCSMWEKCLMHQQTKETYIKKITLWKRLFIHIKSRYPNYGLYLVGSTLTGFGGNKSDMDMCVTVTHLEIDQSRVAHYYLNNICHHLLPLDFITIKEIVQAKVPILKFRDSIRNLDVDLNCNNIVGIRNTHLLYCYSQLDWRVRPLVIVVKLWADFHNINDAKNMTISSYSLTLMVIHFLQYAVTPAVLPCLHVMFPDKFSSHVEISRINLLEELDPYHSYNAMSIGELLVNFFEYYTTFQYNKYAISVRTGSVVPVAFCRQTRSLKNDPHQWKCLCIEEPFDFTNTARSVYNKATFKRILRIFQLTACTLRKSAQLNSIFTSAHIMEQNIKT